MNRFVLGTWGIGGKWSFNNTPYGWGDLSDDEAIQLLKNSVDIGIKSFDTAPNYGCDAKAEKILGKFINSFSKADRNDLKIVSKIGRFFNNGIFETDLCFERLQKQIYEIFSRLTLEPDILLVKDPALEIAKSGLLEKTLQKLETEFRSIQFGVATHKPEICTYFTCSDRVVELETHLINYPIVRYYISYIKKSNGVVYGAMPLLYGFLTDKYHKNHKFNNDDWRTGLDNVYVEKILRKRSEIQESLNKYNLLNNYSLQEIAIAFIYSCKEIDRLIIGPKNNQQLLNSVDSERILNNSDFINWRKEFVPL